MRNINNIILLIVVGLAVSSIANANQCPAGMCKGDNDCASSYCMNGAGKTPNPQGCFYCHVNIPTKKIADGVEMPMAGLGTWTYNNSMAYDAVSKALNLGYTHIDCALGYQNQESVGKALKDSKRERSTYFITSKIPGGLNFSAATASMELSLQQLGLDYVDLMLVHFPAAWSGQGGKMLRLEEWRAMEAFQKSGKAKAIGVSHYCRRHLEDILSINTVPIAVNQVQYHIGMGMEGPNATDDKQFCDEHGITYESFSPLCGPCGKDAHMELITGKMVTDIGKKYGKSGAQVSLKWQVQQGIPVIPRSDSVDHLLENIDLFNWKLSEEDMNTLTQSKSPPVAGDGPNSGDCSVL